MQQCDECGVEGFMPVITEEYEREYTHEHDFCCIQCLVKFFQKEISK